MNISETINYYKSQIESDPGFAKDLLEAELAKAGSMERKAAIAYLLFEVNETLDEMALIAWLEENNIPDTQWLGYYIENGEVKYDAERLNPVVEVTDGN